MMEPPPWASMYFPAAISVRKMPFKLTLITLFHCSKVISSAGTLMQMPALLWQKSSPPSSFVTCKTISSTCFGSVQSVFMAITFLPVSLAIFAAVFSASAKSTSIIATSAPASAKAVAVLLPMPLAPPVTKPFFPSSLIFSIMPILVPPIFRRLFSLCPSLIFSATVPGRLWQTAYFCYLLY